MLADMTWPWPLPVAAVADMFHSSSSLAHSLTHSRRKLPVYPDLIGPDFQPAQHTCFSVCILVDRHRHRLSLMLVSHLVIYFGFLSFQQPGLTLMLATSDAVQYDDVTMRLQPCFLIFRGWHCCRTWGGLQDTDGTLAALAGSFEELRATSESSRFGLGPGSKV